MELHRGINFSRLEVPADAGGLIFVVGSVIVMLLGIPWFRWFVLAATLVGVAVAILLVECHRPLPAGCVRPTRRTRLSGRAHRGLGRRA